MRNTDPKRAIIEGVWGGALSVLGPVELGAHWGLGNAFAPPIFGRYLNPIPIRVKG